MIQKQAYIALDCGAESARVIVGILQQGQLQLEEIHRFPTGEAPLPIRNATSSF